MAWKCRNLKAKNLRKWNLQASIWAGGRGECGKLNHLGPHMKPLVLKVHSVSQHCHPGDHTFLSAPLRNTQVNLSRCVHLERREILGMAQEWRQQKFPVPSDTACVATVWEEKIGYSRGLFGRGNVFHFAWVVLASDLSGKVWERVSGTVVSDESRAIAADLSL